MSYFRIPTYFLFVSALLSSAAVLGCDSNDNDKDISDLTAQHARTDEHLAESDANVADLSARLDSGEVALAELRGKLQAVVAAAADAAAVQAKAQDIAAIAAVASCYGRGHDAVNAELDGDQRDAVAILSTCFAEDVQSEFVYFGNPVQPADQLDGLPALTNYIGSFWANAGYHSARNVPGNVQVELLDSEHARLSYSGTTPHFSLANIDASTDPGAASRSGFIDNISASYVSELERGSDGVWLTTDFTIDVKEVIRVTGTYWLLQ